MSYATADWFDDHPLSLASLHNEVLRVRHELAAMRADLRPLACLAEHAGNTAASGNTRWLSVQEAARTANCTDCTIRRWIANGSLPATKPATSGKKGRWLIRESDLQTFLNASA